MEDLEGEVWKVINGFEEYFISNLGRVRCEDKVKYMPRHGTPYVIKGSIRKTYFHKYGYSIITLMENGVGKKRTIHSLVAEHFIPNPENLPCVMHLDDNPHNNKVDNLAWGTVQDNMDLKVKANRQNKGEGVSCSKLTEQEVIQIRKLSSEGVKNKDLAVLFNISRPVISEIISRKLWKHVN